MKFPNLPEMLFVSWPRLQVFWYIYKQVIYQVRDWQGNSLVRQNQKKIKERKTKWKSKLRILQSNLFHFFNCTISVPIRSYNSFITDLLIDSPEKILLMKVPKSNIVGCTVTVKKSNPNSNELKCKQPSGWSGKAPTSTHVLPQKQLMFHLTLSVFPHKCNKQLKSDMPGKYLSQIFKTM